MALEKTIQTQYGLTANAAYVRVENVNVQKTGIKYSVFIYADKTKPCFDSKVFECAYSIQGANPIAQAYEHLKTLPEFAGAIDC